MIKEIVKEKRQTFTGTESKLVLFNDEFNTFPHVIKSLMDVLKYAPEQAEQCAWIVHYKGKYAVKSGPKNNLLPECTALLDRGLSAEIQ